MTTEELLAEGRRLARPCIYLTKRPEDGPFAGVWGGEGVVPVNAPHHRHWLTILARALPQEFADLKLTGAISIYSDQKTQGGCCMLDPRVETFPIGNRIPLYARRDTRLPQIALLLRSGSPAIQRWLAEINFDLSKPGIIRKGVGKVGDSYTSITFDADPIRNATRESQIVALVGGWPFEVYEDDWKEDVDDPLARQLIFTIEDAEPWIQARVDGSGAFHVRQIGS